MEIFSSLFYGFQVVLQPVNLLYCLIGVCMGQLIGVLPGIGPMGGMSLLLPATFGAPPICGLIMLAGIYYGVMYGGTITSVLVNIPGEAASVITCLDGYQMAKKGRAGPALGISAIGSFIGGTLSLILLMFLVFPLADAALQFGPPEYFGLMLMGITIVVYLVRGSLIKGLIMAFVGLILGCVGSDIVTGKFRFVFGIPELAEGIDLVPLAMGLFGISEVLINIEKPFQRSNYIDDRVTHLLPNKLDWKRSLGPIARGSLIGFFLGVLPGGGAVLSSFVSYTTEKRLSKHPEEFGWGAIEGVAGPETANNAATGGAFVPLLSLGIPPNPIMALLLGALLIHGIYPGPLFVRNHPDLFWGTIASMYVGNGVLLLLNLPLIGMWVKILKVPLGTLFPFVLLFSLIGCYSVNNRAFDVLLMVAFGVVGYILRKLNYEVAPLLLAFILEPMLEKAFRNSLIMSNGDFSIFFTRPISCFTILLSIALFALTGLGILSKARNKVAQ